MNIVKNYLALTFEGNHSLAKKVASFRYRYDGRYHTSPEFSLPIIPSFMIKNENSKDLTESLYEETSSFFHPRDEINVKFVGLDVYPYHRQVLLYLKPEYSFELESYIESVDHLVSQYAYPGQKKERARPYVIIGRFDQDRDFGLALDEAKSEFSFPIQLKINGLTSFLKRSEHWVRQRDIFQFESSGDRVKSCLSF
jgi:hypothetical protein